MHTQVSKDYYKTYMLRNKANECKSYRSEGFKAIKLGWGNFFEADAEDTFAAIREAVGPDTKLMIDIGCPEYWSSGWTVKDAVSVCRVLEKYNFYFAEEVFAPYDMERFGKLTKAVNILTATGESLSTTYEFQPFIDNRAVDIVQPDVAQMGITQVADVVRAAKEKGLLCIPHSPWSAQAVAAHVHIMSLFDNCPMIEYPAFKSFSGNERMQTITHMMHYDIIENPLKVEDGYVYVPDRPGLGLGNYNHEAVNELDKLIREKG